MFVSGLFIEVK